MGQRGDEVRVARFVADQMTMHRVPHTLTCTILGISISWFYKWIGRGPTDHARPRATLDARVRVLSVYSQSATCSTRPPAPPAQSRWHSDVDLLLHLNYP